MKLLASIKNRITDAEIRRAIETVGLDADMKKKVGKLFLGYETKVGYCTSHYGEIRAILLLDEPFNGLDNDGVRKNERIVSCSEGSRKNDYIGQS